MSTMPRSGRLWSLIRNRLAKKGLYDSAAYWDSKAEDFEGLARSNWPSNAYNARMDDEQMKVLDRVFDDVRGLSVADVGCGTGRASIHLAIRGARVTGFDFSTQALAAASREAEQRGLAIQFRAQNVFQPPEPALVGTFDRAVTIGCLGIACSTADDLSRALQHIASLLRPGGRVVFMEPIHRSRLLRRILKLGVKEWIDLSEAAGLRFRERGGLFFVPTRYALAFRELPREIVNPVFSVGEQVLHAWSGLDAWLSDYKWLLFEKESF
jgi:2-polyprenyl-3-methyl-5-hydroxy-6-metoxy-1,4-benzoquinol methylase